ncbi:hypothetical protein LJR289_001063 [Pseudoduganella sp. LjRoot289]|uniref:hypothetical protein n=1 Tax=Pseudoduganella sp. LjRoot289 TaxID=3342314 RepID=UPI003ECC6D18
MNELAFLGSIALLYLMLAVSPGPNFLVITISKPLATGFLKVCRRPIITAC